MMETVEPKERGESVHPLTTDVYYYLNLFMGYTVHLLSFPSTVFGYQLQHMIYKGGPLPKYIK